MTTQHDKPNRWRQRWKDLDWADAGRMAFVSFGIFGLSMMVLVGMGFQPGWANGWPMGIPKHAVFASFVTIIFAVSSVSLAAAVLVMLCCSAEQFLKRPFVGWPSFLVVFVLMLVTIAVSCPGVYTIVHAAIVQDWP